MGVEGRVRKKERKEGRKEDRKMLGKTFCLLSVERKRMKKTMKMRGNPAESPVTKAPRADVRRMIPSCILKRKQGSEKTHSYMPGTIVQNLVD